MQKIVVDTNVMVSALIQRSYPYLIIYELFIEDKIDLCVSKQLLQEYYEVLSRPKFVRYHDFFAKAESLLADIEAKSSKYHPKNKFDMLSDKDDNMILELAYECSADFIITGNTNHFTFSNFHKTIILSPREYWIHHRPIQDISKNL